ncbi:protein arginine N-methyltransferase 7 [Fopius arisanus]|uniref:Protein arginine N-methyltransferase n=1 Tax=Fopius arisanus TaxID=64838 RepID=A0A9R1T7P8_9HYME|nr:PREDICTED: protein arginine N-methyltransferase 7 [Fopius arisanus]
MFWGSHMAPVNLTSIITKCILNRLRNPFRKMSIFIQSFDPITGCAIWEEKDPDYDYHQEVARSAFADMLHDHERNQKYYDALKIAIEKKHNMGEKAHVLDIGTGTGLLSMMAARCGADSITACEAFKPMAKCALEIIKHNGFASQIILIKKRSTEMTVGADGDMKHRANILVTEVFDTELIGEGALQTFRHAQEHLLEKDSIVIPTRGTVYVQIVESHLVDSWHKLLPLRDPETSKILLSPPGGVQTCPGSLAVHDLQLSQIPRDSFTKLSPVLPLFHFDWTGKTPLVFNETKELVFRANSRGRPSGVFMWWNIVMDINEEILLSCSPVWEHPDTLGGAEEIPWRDHWMQAVYYLPGEVEIEENEEVRLIGCHDEYSFWFKLLQGESNGVREVKPPACECSVHLAYPRSRLGQMNNEKRSEKYLKVMKRCITPQTRCFCFSDGSLLGLAAATLGAREVVILETNHLSRRALDGFVEANDLSGRVRIFQDIQQLPKAVRGDLVFGEPYYVNSIFPWDNLRFWYLGSHWAPGVRILPGGATIRGVPVEFKDLHKIRAPLGVCEGFDLGIFDDLVMAASEISDNPVEVHPLWEYPGKALSSPFDLAHFDFNERFDENHEQNFRGTVPIAQCGSCNGIALWIDWHLDPETTVSTGPTTEITPGERISWDVNTRQAVFLLRKIEAVTSSHVLTWSLKYQLKKDRNFVFSFTLEPQ